MKIKAKRAGAEKWRFLPDILPSGSYKSSKVLEEQRGERLKLPVYTVLQQKASVGNQ